MKDTTGISCSGCGHDILVESFVPYIPAVRAGICGPGSKNIATEKNREVNLYYCPNCGLLYDTTVIGCKLKEKGVSPFGLNYSKPQVDSGFTNTKLKAPTESLKAFMEAIEESETEE